MLLIGGSILLPPGQPVQAGQEAILLLIDSFLLSNYSQLLVPFCYLTLPLLAHTRVTQPILNSAKDTVNGIVGILKHLNVMFKTSVTVLCCVDLTFDVAGVAWEFSSGGI